MVVTEVALYTVQDSPADQPVALVGQRYFPGIGIEYEWGGIELE